MCRRLDRYVGVHDLYLRKPNGAVRKLSHGSFWPDCSPNGREVVFIHGNNLQVINLKSGRKRELTVDRSAAAHRLSRRTGS